MNKKNINQVIYLFIAISFISYSFFYIIAYDLKKDLKDTAYEYAYSFDDRECRIINQKKDKKCLYLKEYKKNDEKYQNKKKKLIEESNVDIFKLLSPNDFFNQYIDISSQQLRYVLDRSLYQHQIKNSKEVHLKKRKELKVNYDKLVKDTIKYKKLYFKNIYNIYFNPFSHFLYSLFLIIFYKVSKYYLKINIKTFKTKKI